MRMTWGSSRPPQQVAPGQLRRRPFAPCRSGGENAERRQKHERGDCQPQTLQRTRVAGRRAWRLIPRRAPKCRAQQPGIGSLKIGDQSGADDSFRQPGEGEVANHHRRNGDAQRIWCVKRCAAGIMKERGLDSKLDGGQQSGDVDGEISGDSGCDDAPLRASIAARAAISR